MILGFFFSYLVDYLKINIMILHQNKIYIYIKLNYEFIEQLYITCNTR